MSAEFTLYGTTLRDRTADATRDERLRSSLARAVGRFSVGRTSALATLEDPDALRAAARRIKADVLADLPALLAQFADNVMASGGHVHWATDANSANEYVLSVAARLNARRIVKSKSMATEETGLNHALEAAGIEVTETDLGEWIIQLAHQTPSHIIAPAVHLDRFQVRDIFVEHAGAPAAIGTEPEELAAFARQTLRSEYLRADIGISGCNFAVASTGSIVMVTNEGNGRLCTSVPKVHIAFMGMERLVADWDQLDLFINLLARSASGQHLSTYTNIVTGPRRTGEADGPDEFHVVILDNRRSSLLGTEFAEALACIRCGACLNVCPVYRQVGGHAYGWVYSGPIGAVLTPLLAAHHPEAAELANASTLCGACMDACPVSIPLQDLLLALRRQRATDADRMERAAWAAWAQAWKRPLTYRASLGAARAGRTLSRFVGKLPGLDRWGDGRTPMRPASRGFMDWWKDGER